MTIRNLAVIGECMIELSQQGAQLTRGFGGDTLNTAVYLARQMPEQALQVHYVTALGTDSFSGEMLQGLAAGEDRDRADSAVGKQTAGPVRDRNRRRRRTHLLLLAQ